MSDDPTTVDLVGMNYVVYRLAAGRVDAVTGAELVAVRDMARAVAEELDAEILRRNTEAG